MIVIRIVIYLIIAVLTDIYITSQNKSSNDSKMDS